MPAVPIDYATLEAELQEAAWSALSGPANAAAAKSVRRVVEARTRRWIGHIQGLKRVSVDAQAVPGGIEVTVLLHIGSKVERIGTRVGML